MCLLRVKDVNFPISPGVADTPPPFHHPECRGALSPIPPRYGLDLGLPSYANTQIVSTSVLNLRVHAYLFGGERTLQGAPDDSHGAVRPVPDPHFSDAPIRPKGIRFTMEKPHTDLCSGSGGRFQETPEGVHA